MCATIKAAWEGGRAQLVLSEQPTWFNPQPPTNEPQMKEFYKSQKNIQIYAVHIMHERECYKKTNSSLVSGCNVD